jgi:hypothetical protein
MTQRGTIINGAVVLDGPPKLHEGARVWVAVADADEDTEDYGPPPEPTGETRAEFLDSLRQSIANIKAGKGLSIGELTAKLQREFGDFPREAE